MSSKVKIGLLVAAHVVAGVLLAWRVYTWALFMGLYSALAIGGLVALFLAEAGLVGMWGALGSTSRTGWRLLAAASTLTYVCVVFVTALRGWSWRNLEGLVTAYLAVALPTAVIFLILCGCRDRGWGIRLDQTDAPTRSLQFKLRHLFILTAVAAALLAVGRALEHVPARTDGSQAAILFAIVVPYLVLAELATLWSAMGIGRPIPRLLVVLPMAFVVGAIPPFYLKTHMGNKSDWQVYFVCSSVVALQATITAVSLLVVRSCGWRLWRLRDPPVLDQAMPHSETLAERLRHSLAGRLEEREFCLGGVRFLLNGNMCVGVWKNSLIARLGPEQGELALKQKHVAGFNVTGQPIRGLVLVAPEDIANDDQLNVWIRRAEEFVVTLPGK